MTERMLITDANKALARRLFAEVFNAHSLARCDELYAPNYVPHSLPPGFSLDRDGTKQYLSHYLQAFPDLHWTIETMISPKGTWWRCAIPAGERITARCWASRQPESRRPRAPC